MILDTIVFDLDGTLLDTLQDLANSANYTMKQMGLPTRTKEEIAFFVGRGVPTLLKRTAPDTCSEADLALCLDIFRPHYKEHMYDTTLPYPGILELLKDVFEQKLATAIVSNKTHSAVLELNNRFFSPYITMAVGAPPEQRKPNPASVLSVIQKLGSCPERSVYIGDTEIDILTAHNAGLCCIGCSWGFRNRTFLHENGADYVIDKPSELLPLLSTFCTPFYGAGAK